MSPQMIGEYEVAEKLGEGGMGTVYRAVDRMLERDVALKLLRPDVSDEPELVERFRTEAVILAKLNHPNIATLYRLAREGDSLVMVMEFVRGQTLSRLLARASRLPTAHAVSWCCQVLDAMDYAHEQRVVHRDLKPANIMVTDSGIVKVTDFGIARALGTGRQTRFGFVIGTPAYMSPEQVRGQEVDGRSDIYSLGAVLFELITGRQPFVANDEFSILAAHIGQAPPSPQSLRPDLPAWLDEAILSALAKLPGSRFQTAAEFRGALESGLAELGSGDDDTHPLDLPPPRQRSTTSPRLVRVDTGPAAGTRAAPDATPPAVAPPAPSGPGFESTIADRPVKWWRRRWKLLVAVAALLLILGTAWAIAARLNSTLRRGTQTSAVAAPAQKREPPPPVMTDQASTNQGAPTPGAPTAPPVTPPARSVPTSADRSGVAGAGQRAVGPVPTPTPPSPRDASSGGASVGNRVAPRSEEAPAAHVSPPASRPREGREPISFENVKLLRIEGKQASELDAILSFDAERLTVVYQQTKAVAKTFAYPTISSAIYSQSRHPRWKEGIGVAVLVGVFAAPVFFMKSTKHWLTIQTPDDFVVLRLDKRNFQTIIPAFETRTGVKIEIDKSGK